MTDLTQARQAFLEQQKQQELAATYPKLQAEEDKAMAQTQLDLARIEAQARSEILHSQLERAQEDYIEQFNNLLTALHGVVPAYQELVSIKSQIIANAQQYAGQKLGYQVRFENLGRYDAPIAESKAIGEVEPNEPQLHLAPRENSAFFDTLIRMIHSLATGAQL